MLCLVAVWTWITAVLIAVATGITGEGLRDYGGDDEWQTLFQVQLLWGGVAAVLWGALVGCSSPRQGRFVLLGTTPDKRGPRRAPLLVLQLEGFVQRLHRFRHLPFVDQAGDADLARRDQLDVYACFEKGAEHPPRVTEG
jgi:hypothetical protein